MRSEACNLLLCAARGWPATPGRRGDAAKTAQPDAVEPREALPVRPGSCGLRKLTFSPPLTSPGPSVAPSENPAGRKWTLASAMATQEPCTPGPLICEMAVAEPVLDGRFAGACPGRGLSSRLRSRPRPGMSESAISTRRIVLLGSSEVSASRVGLAPGDAVPGPVRAT